MGNTIYSVDDNYKIREDTILGREIKKENVIKSNQN